MTELTRPDHNSVERGLITWRPYPADVPSGNTRQPQQGLQGCTVTPITLTFFAVVTAETISSFFLVLAIAGMAVAAGLANHM